MDLPTERYGRPPAWQRTVGIPLVAVAVLAFLGWLVWAALAHSTSAVEAVVQSFRVRSPHAVNVRLEISRSSDAAVRCTVTALARDHAPVGERSVVFPAGPNREQTFTVSVRTERKATSATVQGC